MGPLSFAFYIKVSSTNSGSVSSVSFTGSYCKDILYALKIFYIIFWIMGSCQLRLI